MNFFLCLSVYVLFSSVQSVNMTLPVANAVEDQKADSSKNNIVTKTNVTLVSEGGTLLQNTLPKQKLNSLMTLDEELSKTKEKSVVPRKGVDNMLPIANISSEDHKDETIIQTKSSVKDSLTTTKIPVPTLVHVNTTKTLQSNTTTAPPMVTTTHHKKPLKLSYEAIANMEKEIQSQKTKIQAVPSIETLTSSQIASPNKDSIVKVYPTKANSHPGMIMPIVITILVVPMFAIVGYMVLKKGQEAWKNRHYKRMDFLLDGMYND